MEGDNGKKRKSLEVEKIRLIDISSEDDFLIVSPSANAFENLRLSVDLETRNEHDSFKLLDIGNPQEEENAAGVLGPRKLAFLPSESLEPGRPIRSGKCNLRKSLAWDSAFFTNEGVLDPDELFIINKGFKKAETHLLPAIEEVWRSVESNSTVDSDGFSLKSLEIDLFEDIRASIQKSRKASYVASSRCIQGKGAASKKMEVAPRNMMKSMSASKRQSVNTKGLERITKEVYVRSQAEKGAARSGESNVTPSKPPNTSGRADSISAAPAKKASVGANHSKMESKTAKAAFGTRRHLMVSKKPCLGNSCNLIPGSTSPKSVSSSYSRSGSASSDSTSKSPLISLRRKIDSGNHRLAVSGSTLRTPLRCSTRKKIELQSSTCSTSLPKPASCKSPASSMDGWSSASLSSCSTNSQSSNNMKASLDTTCREVLFESGATQASDLESYAHDQSYMEQESEGTRLLDQCVKIASIGMGPVSTDLSRNFRPSGLRVPSPKIGFFDAEKSMMPMLNGGMQFHSGAQSTLPKIGTGISNLNRVTNRTRHGKLQPARTLMEATKSCLSTAVKVQKDIFPKMSREDCLKPREVGAGRHDASELGLGFSSKAEHKGTLGCLNDIKGTKSKGQVHLRANKIRINKDGSDHSQEDINPSKKENEKAEPRWLETNLHLLHKNAKENLFNFEDQVDGLSKHVGSIDISGDVKIELKGKKAPSHSQLSVNNFENHGVQAHSSSCEYLHGKKESSLRMLSKPSPLSFRSADDIIPSTRTPFAINSIHNRSGLFELLAESTVDNVVEKISNHQLLKDTEKENC